MSRDPLAEATRALREEADASPARPDETRARVPEVKDVRRTDP